MRLAIAAAGLLLLLVSPSPVTAETKTPSGNPGTILSAAAAPDGSIVLTACSEGYVVGWDPAKRTAIDRFQLGPYALTSIVLRPGHSEIAVVENDGLGLYRVSAWNYAEKKRLFTLRFRDAVSRIAYSAQGTYLMVARNSYDGIVLLDPTSGDTVQTAQDPTGLVNLVSTGKSERTMVTYSVSGEISYWNTATGALIERLAGTPGLSDTSLFGNGRFLFGTTPSAMVIVDALSGRELARKPLSGRLGGVSSNDVGLIFIREAYGTFHIGRVAVLSDRPPVFEPEQVVTSGSDAQLAFPVVSAGKKVLFATRDGRTAIADAAATGPAEPLSVNSYLRVDDAAYEGNQIAALIEGKLIGLPAIPASFKQDAVLKVLMVKDADRLLSLSSDKYLLWRNDGSVAPTIRDRTSAIGELPILRGTPLISVQRFGTTLSFLDSYGNLTLYDRSSGSVIYKFTSIGLMDAAFVDDRRMILAKSGSVPPFAPLVILNYRTGETSPMAVPGKAAVRLHRGESGSIYTVVAESEGSGAVTRIFRLEPDSRAGGSPLLEYRADDLQAYMAEAGGFFATTLGGDGILLLKDSQFSRFERTSALPSRIVSAGINVLSICDDGALAWHDPLTGGTSAVLRFIGDSWELTRGKETLSGRVEGFGAER